MRFCINHQESNITITKDSYLIPIIEHILDKMHGKLFLKPLILLHMFSDNVRRNGKTNEFIHSKEKTFFD